MAILGKSGKMLTKPVQNVQRNHSNEKTGFEKYPNQESKWHFGNAQSAFFMTFWPHAPKRDATFS
jgi:hypothetical protein